MVFLFANSFIRTDASELVQEVLKVVINMTLDNAHDFNGALLLYAKLGEQDRCEQTFVAMQERGFQPTQLTYGPASIDFGSVQVTSS